MLEQFFSPRPPVTTLAGQVEARFGTRKFGCPETLGCGMTDQNWSARDFTAENEVIYHYVSFYEGHFEFGPIFQYKTDRFRFEGRKIFFTVLGAHFELQITLASQVEAGFGPDLGPKNFNIGLVT